MVCRDVAFGSVLALSLAGCGLLLDEGLGPVSSESGLADGAAPPPLTDDGNTTAADVTRCVDLPEGTESGAYTLRDGPAYCDMGRAGGGWTLALKADGESTSFSWFNDFYWLQDNVLNAVDPNLDAVEAKYPAYNTMPAVEVLLVMRSPGGMLRELVLPLPGPPLPLLERMNGGATVVDVGRDAWLSLVDGAYLQPNCNRAGINPSAYAAAFVRIGIVGNNEDDCGSPDSWIGVGGAPMDYSLPDAVQFCGEPSATGNATVGNARQCSGENDGAVTGFAYMGDGLTV